MNSRYEFVASRVPQHLKEDWGEYYWWNEVTNEVDWHPRAVFWQEHQNENGQTYYYNAFTGESTWELPEEAAWEARHSKVHWRSCHGRSCTQRRPFHASRCAVPAAELLACEAHAGGCVPGPVQLMSMGVSSLLICDTYQP